MSLHIKSFVCNWLPLGVLLINFVSQAQVKSSIYTIGGGAHNIRFLNTKNSPRISGDIGIHIDKSWNNWLHIRAQLGIQHFSFYAKNEFFTSLYHSHAEWVSHLTYGNIGMATGFEYKKIQFFYGINFNPLMRAARNIHNYKISTSTSEVIEDFRVRNSYFQDMPGYLLFMQGHVIYQLNNSWALTASYSRSLSNPWEGSNYYSTEKDRIFNACVGVEYFLFQR